MRQTGVHVSRASSLTPSLDRVPTRSPAGPGGHIARCRVNGRKRAAFWHSLGFPNLVKARRVSARNRRARKLARLFAEAKRRNPFALEKTPRGYCAPNASKTREPPQVVASLVASHNCQVCRRSFPRTSTRPLGRRFGSKPGPHGPRQITPPEFMSHQRCA